VRRVNASARFKKHDSNYGWRAGSAPRASIRNVEVIYLKTHSDLDPCAPEVLIANTPDLISTEGRLRVRGRLVRSRATGIGTGYSVGDFLGRRASSLSRPIWPVESGHLEDVVWAYGGA
jgi:hypothetical protein